MKKQSLGSKITTNMFVYNNYKINGFPNHFYTEKATNKYNNKLLYWCSHLTQNAKDLTYFQRLKRKIYIMYLDIYDAAIARIV